MVAYSFAPQFRDQVRLLIKRQTVRAFRRRHAVPGEPIQLYTAMRTKHCRKLVDPDPTCVRVRLIEIMIRFDRKCPIDWIAIEGRKLSGEEAETFAVADGFSRRLMHSALAEMGEFWLAAHGSGRFEGVLIEWEPSNG